MNFFRELVQNASATYQLQPRYYWLTTLVGFAIVAVGLLFLFAAGSALAEALHLPMDTPAKLDPRGKWWMAGLLLAIPVCFYASTLLVAGAFALVMVALGKFSLNDAFYYATRSRYPASWFRSDGKA
nr:unknown [uncultured bacterium]